LAGATIDHLVSVTIFLAAMLLFISFFNQTIQTAVIYQQHNALATKCSDLLDNMLLTPGIPVDAQPTVFGLHEINFAGYTLDPFSLMRLNSSTGTAYYEKKEMEYSNMSVGFGNSLLMPINDSNLVNNVISYSWALETLGISGAYGFQLTLTPIVNVSIAEVQPNPLKLSINVSGVGFPLANTPVSYRLIAVSLNESYPEYLPVPNQAGIIYTDAAGFSNRTFTDFARNATHTYVFVAYAHVGGLAGISFYAPDFSGRPCLIPFVKSLSENEVLLAHSSDVPYTASSSENLTYNEAFVKLSNENFELQNIATGEVSSGAGHDPQVMPVPNYAEILVVAYKDTSGSGGVAVVPWGVGSLAFPVAFGGNPAEQEWVATDMRQVLIGGVAYQVKLSLWSLQGVQVVG
jgi:hypothetical protein